MVISPLQEDFSDYRSTDENMMKLSIFERHFNVSPSPFTSMPFSLYDMSQSLNIGAK
jgi:hypothetical protein